jgi:dTDP-4-amino-4,6-dideoxygalactose transaminase
MLDHLPGLTFMPETAWGRHNRWLTVLLLDSQVAGVNRETICTVLEAEDIEARPVWKPMHLQPVFSGFAVAGGAMAETLFDQGWYLPSGSSLSQEDLLRVGQIIK